MNVNTLIIVILTIFGLVTIGYCDLVVTGIDVGQGDSELVTSDNFTMLIDGGESNGMAYHYLVDHGIDNLDYVVASHPHDDHIGGLVDTVEDPSYITVVGLMLLDMLLLPSLPPTQPGSRAMGSAKGFVDSILGRFKK